MPRVQNKSSISSQHEPEIIDLSNQPVIYVDWIVAAGFGPAFGSVNLDLGAIVPGEQGSARPKASIQCKLRMTTATAQNIVRSLSAAIAAAQGVTASGAPTLANVN